MYHVMNASTAMPTRADVNDQPAEHGLLATTRYLPRRRLERSEVLARHLWMAPGLRSLAKGRRAMANWDQNWDQGIREGVGELFQKMKNPRY